MVILFIQPATNGEIATSNLFAYTDGLADAEVKIVVYQKSTSYIMCCTAVSRSSGAYLNTIEEALIACISINTPCCKSANIALNYYGIMESISLRKC
jgi:hypothetical protein